MQLKFLLDENVDVGLGRFLKKYSSEVINCPKGLTDQQVFTLIKQDKLILLTNDKDFANSDIYKPTVDCAIVVFRIHPPLYQHLTAAFQHLLKSQNFETLLGKITVVYEQSAEIITT